MWPYRRRPLDDVANILSSGLFDVAFYENQTGLSFESAKEAITHFLAAATAEARDPHPLFSVSWYAAHTSGLGPNDNALLHYISGTAAKGSQPHPLFDPAWYLRVNRLRRAAAANPLSHYVRVGGPAGLRAHPLFDAAWYRDANPDVAAVGVDPFIHFVRFGASERRSPGADFDAAWYLDRYPDVAEARGNPLLHYLTNGAAEGRDPSADFSTRWYRETYRDVAASGQNPLVHYVERGRAKGNLPRPGPARPEQVDAILASGLFDLAFYGERTGKAFDTVEDAVGHFFAAPATEAHDPHPLFSVSWYVARSPDLGPAGNALLHYLSVGAGQGRQPHPLFDPAWYLHVNSNHPAATDDPLAHYLGVGGRAGLRVHPLFDARWYRQTYPDIAASGMDPFVHFARYGAGERRSPSAYFDARWYLERYPDVAAAGHNPLAHYLTKGAAEGHDPSADFSTRWYLQVYPDVAAAGQNPLMHYVENGRAEGRETRPEKQFKLDARFGMSRSEFDVWLDLVRSRTSGTPAIRTRLPGQHTGGRKGRRGVESGLLVAALVPSGDGDANEAAAMTRAGVEREAEEAGLACRIVDAAGIAAADMPDGAIVLFLHAGDRPVAGGLGMMLGAMGRAGDVCVFDTFYEVDGTAYPVLQPGANPAHLRSVDSTFSRFAIRGRCLRALDLGKEAANPRDILLAALDTIVAARTWGALVHCAAPVLQTPDLTEDIRGMREEAVRRRPVASPEPLGRVSVVICTKDKGHLLDQLLRSLVEEDAVAEIVIVSNQTSNVYARHTLARWNEHPKVTVIDYDKPFNFSVQCNLAARACHGEYMLFLNDDIVPVTPDWLSHLLAPFTDPSVAVTGPLLLYPDERVQHAGMYLGHHGTAGHALRRARIPDGDYLFRASAARDVSCLTGAVLLMRRSCFIDLNGFDQQLVSLLQDVDICLRVTRLRYRIIYVPSAILIHMESVSVFEMLEAPGSGLQRIREQDYFFARYGRLSNSSDIFHNPSFAARDETMKLMI